MKKIVFLGVLSVLVASLCFAGGAKDYETTKTTDKDNYLESKVSYPTFNIPVLDEAIQATIVQAYEDFKVTSKTDWEEHTAFLQQENPEAVAHPHVYQVSYDKPLITDKYVSVLFTTYMFEGGAHGITKLTSFTYDKEQDKLLSITEASGMTLEEIASLCQLKLKADLESEPSSGVDRAAWIEEGTKPEEQNFRIFTFDGTTLTVYFEHYTVAPYAAGIQKVEIPCN